MFRSRSILIEDAAHACGSEYRGKKTGAFGDAALFSFGTGKSLVTLGGGMFVTSNSLIAIRIQETLEKNYVFQNRTNFIKSSRVSDAVEIAIENVKGGDSKSERGKETIDPSKTRAI